MATAAGVPVALYLRSSYEPDAEYVDGEIEERPMGERDHAYWQQALQRWFLLYAEAWNIRVLAELRVQVGPARYRVPDVTVFDRARPAEQILTHPPIAVFEVLSPEDAMARVMTKLRDCEQMGVPHIIVVDPATRTIYRFVGGGLERVVGSVQELPGSPCWIDWDTVQGFLD